MSDRNDATLGADLKFSEGPKRSGVMDSATLDTQVTAAFWQAII